MHSGLILAFAPKSPEPALPITPEHLDQVTTSLWLAVTAIAVFFVLRPELWKRLWLERVDPRGAALARIALGATVVWSFIDLAVLGEFLFTDEGLWLTDMARKNYGGKLKTVWDPEQGFETWKDFFLIFTSKWTVLHMRSDPPFVWTIYGCLLLCGVCMTLGWRTRLMTFLTWILANQIYNYSPIFYTGGDTVLRVMLFLGVFMRWGEAYSLDTWRRRRKAILGGATSLPPLRKIPAWPMRLMMLQLTIIYCATGLLKSGGTWWNGTALYYAMNLDHFYRVPLTEWTVILHYLGFLPMGTFITHWWEMLFPLALVGVTVQHYERHKKAGTWPHAPRWRRWLSWSLVLHLWLIGAYATSLAALHYYKGRYIGLREGLITNQQAQWIAFAAVIVFPALLLGAYHLARARYPRVYRLIHDWLFGKRLWLGLGFLFHLGIEVSMNVGTFVQVMWASYPAWLRGSDVESFWGYMQSRAAAPGEGSRPDPASRKKRKRFARLFALIERSSARALHRVPRDRYLVFHAEDEGSIRRAALLRCWDLSQRLEFVADADAPAGALCVSAPGEKERRTGSAAAALLTRIIPGLWVFWPVHRVPGVGWLALRLLHQK